MAEVNIENLSKKEITQFARQLAKTNTALWNAICLVDELVHNPIFKAMGDYGVPKEAFEKVAHVFKEIKKNDEGFVDVGNHSSYLQDFDSFTIELQKYLD